MENDNRSFSYTYSASDTEEIKSIRKKYLPEEEDKMERLRKLDRSVTRKASIISLVLGVIGSLVLGVGMCCVMVWQEFLFAVGIAVGVVGIALIALAYPVYKRIEKKERARIAPEIIRLSDDLLFTSRRGA